MLNGATRTALCVVDYPYWITAKMAEELARHTHGYRVCIASIEAVLAYGKRRRSILNGFDVVHFLTPHLYPRCKHLLSSVNSVVTSVHHLENSRHDETIRNSDAIGTLCSQWQNRLIERGVPREKLFRIGIGVDPVAFSVLGPCEKQKARRDYNINANEFVVGFVAKASSNSSDRKGIDVFEKACRLAASRIENLKVFVVGHGWRRAVRSMMRNDLRVLNVKFLPSEQDLVRYYSCLDACVISSRIEGGPMPLLESLASGVPVVSTRVGLAEEVIRHGENGYLVEIDDANAIAHSLEQLSHAVVSDKESIRESVLQSHTWEIAQRDASRAYDFAIQSSNSSNRNSLPEIDPQFLVFARAHDAAMVARYYLTTQNYREGALASWHAISSCMGIVGFRASALRGFLK